MTSAEPTLPALTDVKVRHLDAEALGMTPPAAAGAASLPAAGAVPAPELEPLPEDDPILGMVRDLIQTYGGVIFTGPPGTSKSWYAVRVGVTLVGPNTDRLRMVQFHPSYQYEDFVEGFVPQAGSFVLVAKHFLEMCQACDGLAADEYVVLVIDELSRGDPRRVFGEALTYLEKSKRGITFRLASGTECMVPPNLVILATMNPLDRGVDEVDAALERRFAKIAMEPSDAVLARLLASAGMQDDLRDRVLRFFRDVNERSKRNPHAALGHTYFTGVPDESALQRLWEHQLRFHFDKAYRLDADGREAIYRAWDAVLAVAAPAAPSDTAEAVADEAPEEEGT